MAPHFFGLLFGGRNNRRLLYSMDEFSFGVMVGRLLFAYLLVWFICFIFSKANYHRSVKRTHSGKGMISIGALFALPLLVQIGSVL